MVETRLDSLDSRLDGVDLTLNEIKELVTPSPRGRGASVVHALGHHATDRCLISMLDACILVTIACTLFSIGASSFITWSLTRRHYVRQRVSHVTPADVELAKVRWGTTRQIVRDVQDNLVFVLILGSIPLLVLVRACN